MDGQMNGQMKTGGHDGRPFRREPMRARTRMRHSACALVLLEREPELMQQRLGIAARLRGALQRE